MSCYYKNVLNNPKLHLIEAKSSETAPHSAGTRFSFSNCAHQGRCDRNVQKEKTKAHQSQWTEGRVQLTQSRVQRGREEDVRRTRCPRGERHGSCLPPCLGALHIWSFIPFQHCHVQGSLEGRRGRGRRPPCARLIA